MKRLIALIITITPLLLQAQSMATIFALLPPNCAPELDSPQKDTLLKNKEYVIPGSDTMETAKYDLAIDEVAEYLRYEFSFTTGQRGFHIYEVRKFRKKDGNSLILFSSYAGAPATFDQTEIYAFKYENARLVAIDKQFLPVTINTSIFLKSNTPHSIKQKIEGDSNRAYDLSPGLKDTVAYRLYFGFIDGKIEKYLLGDMVLFTWTGSEFVQTGVTNSK